MLAGVSEETVEAESESVSEAFWPHAGRCFGEVDGELALSSSLELLSDCRATDRGELTPDWADEELTSCDELEEPRRFLLLIVFPPGLIFANRL
jgi:hypothetical protein